MNWLNGGSDKPFHVQSKDDNGNQIDETHGRLQDDYSSSSSGGTRVDDKLVRDKDGNFVSRDTDFKNTNLGFGPYGKQMDVIGPNGQPIHGADVTHVNVVPQGDGFTRIITTHDQGTITQHLGRDGSTVQSSWQHYPDGKTVKSPTGDDVPVTDARGMRDQNGNWNVAYDSPNGRHITETTDPNGKKTTTETYDKPKIPDGGHTDVKSMSVSDDGKTKTYVDAKGITVTDTYGDGNKLTQSKTTYPEKNGHLATILDQNGKEHKVRVNDSVTTFNPDGKADSIVYHRPDGSEVRYEGIQTGHPTWSGLNESQVRTDADSRLQEKAISEMKPRGMNDAAFNKIRQEIEGSRIPGIEDNVWFSLEKNLIAARLRDLAR
jgi:hypothetical protein